MKFTNNHRIIFLYSTVFMLVSLNTVYLPVWLNEVINLSTQHIGLLIGVVGSFKIFSNFTITKNLKTIRTKIIAILLIIFSIFFSFTIIIFFKNIYANVTIFLSFLILIIFSPILPIVENINTNANKNFYGSYGKLRISGSIAFCLAVLLVGIFLDKFGTENLPLFYIIFILFFLTSVLTIAKKENKKKEIPKSNILKLLQNKNFVIIIFTCSLVLASHAMYYSFSAIYWRKLNIGLFQIGFLWFWGVLAEIIFFILIDKIKIRSLFFQAIIFVGVICFLRWLLTYFFSNFFLLILIQSLHAFTFGLSHYLVIYYIYSYISEDNKLLALSLYHSLSSGILMTILTILAGYSFNYNMNGIGFLYMSVFGLASASLIYLRGFFFRNELK